MRDRRNTSLSISSTASSNSNLSLSSRDSLYEKRPLFSPPLSPTLPVHTGKEKWRKATLRRSIVLKAIIVVCLLFAIWHYAGHKCWASDPERSSHSPQHDTNVAGLIGGDALPDLPTALIVENGFGHPKWTISIPPTAKFPLAGDQYKELCMQGDILRNRLATTSRLSHRRRKGYSYPDTTYLDVAAAEDIAVLPKAPHSEEHNNTCASSLTLVLQDSDASFGKTVLLMWLSYGLAKYEGRAFIIDDSQWAYGRFSDYFKPPPPQHCSPPPPSHVVPCPHSAKHLLVSAATVDWIFGTSFLAEFEQPRRGSLESSRKVFDLIRTGHDALFHMIDEDAAYVDKRVALFKDEAAMHNGSLVGMHIRRGDQHPIEYEYQFSYLPLERYTSAALSLLHNQLHYSNSQLTTPAAPHSTSLPSSYRHSPILLASDDPDILTSPEVAEAVKPLTIAPAQDKLRLATKAALDKISPAEPLRTPGSAYVKHVDENAGWEGGFYAALFYSLGREREHKREHKREHEHDYGNGHGVSVGVPNEDSHAMRMRRLVARGYLLDVAILGRSGGVVCAVSSAACRVLGVVMGWEAVREGRWVNVDDGRGWSWDGVRR